MVAHCHSIGHCLNLMTVPEEFISLRDTSSRSTLSGLLADAKMCPIYRAYRSLARSCGVAVLQRLILAERRIRQF